MIEVNKNIINKDEKFKKFYHSVISDIKDLKNSDLKEQEQESQFVKNLRKRKLS